MYTKGAQPTLVVDRMSSARRLTDDALRAWAQTQAVFISSVMTDLATERRLLASMIAELGATPVLFEDFGGRDQGAQEAYLSGVARCDTYLGVVGDRYGAITPTGRSATHQEYREAVAASLTWADIDATAAYAHGRDAARWLRSRPGRSGLVVWVDGSTTLVDGQV